MHTAVIGYTGFVGSNIAAQGHFDDSYNTSNISDIEGEEYGLIVSAGARAEKWRINQEPEKDLAEIDNLIDHIKKTQAKKLVLISTVDVYKQPYDVDEDTPIETEGLHAYGSNRYHLEQFCRAQFDTTIIRLPGLFGNGLKKNVIYDLMNSNNLDKIHHAGSFQYYNLDYIWHDIKKILNDSTIRLINLATPPLRTGDIAKQCFGKDFVNEPEGVVPGFYDVHTKYGHIFGMTGDYICSDQQELDDIKNFVKRCKATT